MKLYSICVDSVLVSSSGSQSIFVVRFSSGSVSSNGSDTPSFLVLELQIERALCNWLYIFKHLAVYCKAGFTLVSCTVPLNARAKSEEGACPHSKGGQFKSGR